MRKIFRCAAEKGEEKREFFVFYCCPCIHRRSKRSITCIHRRSKRSKMSTFHNVHPPEVQNATFYHFSGRLTTFWTTLKLSDFEKKTTLITHVWSFPLHSDGKLIWIGCPEP